MARDEVDTAGAPDTVKITPDKRAIAADGKALSYLTVDVVDKDGVMVPDANNELSFSVSGGKLMGLDNGQEESAENYKSSQRAAFNGKALAIIQSSTSSGPITVTVTSPGLLPQTQTIFAGTGGVEPVYGRGAAGSAPSLPATVRQVDADGVDLDGPGHLDRPGGPGGRPEHDQRLRRREGADHRLHRRSRRAGDDARARGHGADAPGDGRRRLHRRHRPRAAR